MQINNTNVAGTNQYEVQSMVDPIVGPLPADVLPIIFQNGKTDLPNLALVCKNWKAIVDNKEFREMIRPAKAFGSREWKEYIGVDAGEELPLPRRVYGDMEKGNYYLTFIPKSVKVTQENGKLSDTSMDIEVAKEVPLDSLEVIGKLVANAIKGNKSGDYPDSWILPIREKRNLEKPHWVLISKEIIGRSEDYKDQQKLAKEENKNNPGTNISGLMDTAISLFMEYVRSGERNFIWNSDNSKLKGVRVIEQTQGSRLCLGFANSGIRFDSYSNTYYACFGLHVDGYSDHGDGRFGIALARKFYGS